MFTSRRRCLPAALVLSALALLPAVPAAAQTAPAHHPPAIPSSPFSLQGPQNHILIGLLLPAVQKIREAAARNRPLMVEFRSLNGDLLGRDIIGLPAVQNGLGRQYHIAVDPSDPSMNTIMVSSDPRPTILARFKKPAGNQIIAILIAGFDKNNRPVLPSTASVEGRTRDADGNENTSFLTPFLLLPAAPIAGDGSVMPGP